MHSFSFPHCTFKSWPYMTFNDAHFLPIELNACVEYFGFPFISLHNCVTNPTVVIYSYDS